MSAFFENIKKQMRRGKSPESSLDAMPQTYCDISNLGHFDRAWLAKTFADPGIAKEWMVDAERIGGLEMPEMTGGVNPGDRRALYYLVRRLKPKSFLEIGTHIGSSTVSLASAMTRNSENGVGGQIISVDIRDVNCDESRPLLDAKAPMSHKAFLKALGLEQCVTFEVNTAVSRLQNRREQFDVIFLDGDHSNLAVYSEIPLALDRLSGISNGLIILHDYFPDLKPIWPGEEPLAGPYLAVKKLLEQGAEFSVLPLGELPWPTKLGSQTTSLAILTRNE